VDARWCVPADLSPDAVARAGVVVLGHDSDLEEARLLAASIRTQHPQVKIVLLSTLDTRDLARAGTEWPDAVLSREATGESFVQVMRSLLEGTVVEARVERPRLVYSVPGPRLTRAEARVLRHVAAGFSNDEIAGSLGISTNTVRTHVQRVNGKLGADSRLRAVALARESGVLDLPPTTAIGP